MSGQNFIKKLNKDILKNFIKNAYKNKNKSKRSFCWKILLLFIFHIKVNVFDKGIIPDALRFVDGVKNLRLKNFFWTFL